MSTKEWAEEGVISVKDGRYFSAIVFVEGERQNWLGAIYQDPGEPYHFAYRFRYYNDDEGDCEEMLTVGVAKADITEVQALSDMNTAARQLMETGFGQRCHKLNVRTSNALEIIRALAREEWAVVKMVEKNRSAS